MNQDSVKEEQRKAAEELVDKFTRAKLDNPSIDYENILVDAIAYLLSQREQAAAENAARAMTALIQSDYDRWDSTKLTMMHAARVAAAPFLKNKGE